MPVFAFLFYYSPYRNKPDEQEQYLHAYLDEKRMHVKTFVNNSSNKIKVYKNHKITLSDFLRQMNIYRHVDLLALDLKRNGLSKDDVIEKFTKFTKTLLDEIIKAFIIFKNQDDFKHS